MRSNNSIASASLLLPLLIAVPVGVLVRSRDNERRSSNLLDIGRASILKDDAASLAVSGHEGIPTIIVYDRGASILTAEDHGRTDCCHRIGVAVLS